MTRDPHSDRLLHPNVNPSHLAYTSITARTNLATLWHRCLGHAHPDVVITHLQQCFNKTLSRGDFIACDDCVMGKLRHSPSTSSFHRSSHVLDVIHSDIIGPITPSTFSGTRYILTFINDHTRHNTIFLLKDKMMPMSNFVNTNLLWRNRPGGVLSN